MLITNYSETQNFEEIKRKYSSKTPSILFRDDEFRPCNESIGSNAFLRSNKLITPRLKEVKWERARVKLIKFLKLDKNFYL